jgi:hypothetical protein
MLREDCRQEAESASSTISSPASTASKGLSGREDIESALPSLQSHLLWQLQSSLLLPPPQPHLEPQLHFSSRPFASTNEGRLKQLANTIRGKIIIFIEVSLYSK